MTLLILSPPAILVRCPNGPRCPCGAPGLALPLTGGSPHVAAPQAALWASTGWRRGRLGMVPVVGEA
jgi:hypothetical protein